MTATPQALRYLIVVVLGLGVDLGLAVMLVGAGAPRPLASAAGLICGAAFNFALHRAWTFKSTQPQAVLPQIVSYAVSIGMILLVRLIVLAVLDRLPMPISDPLAIFLATGFSFIVNFFVLQRLVFKGRVDS
ncbi:GtrA family protein [Paracoccus laeviglucosivorans]|uniref:Flippase GtrA (Transmembrane translocase of bactoprenol-linked glucose) n=1 Tax=Paracoccus laeviglucosivorans TaxID=1197861 RepID=A0A521E501_9RHOB|nr:GtrA family protein [Paracoccus laeviglucosivorans]SMO78441.1 Putative flippase GtrA (transmembrane translocase of bactoprenol-linked glucose) [Paracoccus laeviglucosivorans]